MISIVSFSESRGGAAKAAQKYFAGLCKTGADTQYVVVEKQDPQSSAVSPSPPAFLWHFCKRLIAYALQQLQRSDNCAKHSMNLFTCGTVMEAIKCSELVHLNWINNETISLEKLPSIRGKIVITLHDEWFYCGSEHLAFESVRPFEGYKPENKRVKGVDWDLITWTRKLRALSEIKDRVIFTVPSRWMLERASKSLMLHDFPIRLVPNYLDTDVFRPFPDKILEKVGVSDETKVILFGAAHGKNMHLKGFHLLAEALNLLRSRIAAREDVKLVSFGGRDVGNHHLSSFEHIELGPVADPKLLAQLYSSATFTVVPSLVESFGQVAAESLSCETPVLSFDCAGLRDIVGHQTTGFLAEAFSPESLCEGMEWLLALQPDELRQVGAAGRRHVLENFSESVVMAKLLQIYQEHGFVL